MITLLIVLAALAAYLWIGWRFVGPRCVMRAMVRHVERYPSLTSPKEMAHYRREAQGEAWGPVFAWPLCLLAWLFTGKLAIRAPLTDFEAKQKAEAQAARIAELESQLGIKS